VKMAMVVQNCNFGNLKYFFSMNNKIDELDTTLMKNTNQIIVQSSGNLETILYI